MLFVGFCGFLCRTPGLSTRDPNEDRVDLRRSLSASRVDRGLPSLVARDPRVTSTGSCPAWQVCAISDTATPHRMAETLLRWQAFRSVLIDRVVAHAKLTAPDATPCEALGESIDLIVMTPGKSQYLGGEFLEPSRTPGKAD